MRKQTEYAIETEALSKKFGDFTAVSNVNLNIEKGEIFGLLGPNGAGKTTTIKMLATLLKPSSGFAEVWNCNILKEQDAVRRSIGIVFQDPSVDTELTGRENLDFHARMYGLNKEERERRINEVLDLVELNDRANVFVKFYSGGMQRRLEIARGLMHYPKVLFLDEPTLGLDAQTRHSIWDHIKILNKAQEVTVVLTTHYMEEADYLCDRVAIIDHGKIIALDIPNNLKNTIGKDIISLQVSDGGKFLDTLTKNEYIKKLSLKKKHDDFLYLSVENGETMIPRIMHLAHEEGVSVQSVSLRKPTLEDVFLHFTGRTIREQEASVKEQIRMKAKASMRMGGKR
ncbi:MAG: ATP-binding cassette domain-containing protein [Methanophagales archaeon]|nr:ATP-binding cassette domain-containing protein [Methanophagales archaeon]